MILVRQHVEFLWYCFGYSYDLDYQVFRVWHKGLVMVLWFWTVVSSSFFLRQVVVCLYIF